MLSLLLYTGCTAATQPVKLDQPFTLRVGESVRVGPEELLVVLRSMAGDSGCFLPDDCSYMIFNGSLALVAGKQGHLSRLDADFRPGEPASVTFAGYKIKVLSTHRPCPPLGDPAGHEE